MNTHIPSVVWLLFLHIGAIAQRMVAIHILSIQEWKRLHTGNINSPTNIAPRLIMLSMKQMRRISGMARISYQNIMVWKYKLFDVKYEKLPLVPRYIFDNLYTLTRKMIILYSLSRFVTFYVAQWTVIKELSISHQKLYLGWTTESHHNFIMFITITDFLYLLYRSVPFTLM